MDYKNTLNLPQTNFSMRANSAQREPELQAYWSTENIYQQNLNTRSGPAYVLHDGPPYLSSNKIHIGHALNRILKDTVVKYQTLNNHPSPLIFGYDCHGLPIENEVSKKLGSQAATLSPLEIREHCAAFAHENLKGQMDNFYRLGLMGDWQNPYLTMHPAYEGAQLRVFAEMVDKGYIYKGVKPVYWSIAARTALAEAEIEYQDHLSPSIYVKMEALGTASPQDFWSTFNAQKVYFVIWTTTPWTLPANLAIAVNAEFDYVFVPTPAGEVLIMAEALVESVQQQTGLTFGEPLRKVKGHELEHAKYQHPFYDRVSPIILGQHVTAEAGTGCVHTAPGHGMDDFIIGEKYKLGVLSPVNAEGIYTDEAPLFEGMYYAKANPVIIDMLKNSGHLLHHSEFVHSYPHCWRTKTPLIYRATEQWFASVDGFRQAALAAVEQVQWIPASGQERIANMIADRSDWCISRQRVWGVPIPAFYCQQCQHTLLNKSLVLHVAQQVADSGSNIWWQKTANELLPANTTCPQCQSNDFRKENAIMDVWFDSGTSHSGVLKERQLKYPCDLYLEGSDQHRGWFQSSLLTAIAAYGTPPYETVLTHGFVLDGQGRKMSKSLGNTVEPQKVIEQYGADVLRLWVASVDYSTDVKISYDIMGQLAEIYKKIRNTCRFLISNLYDFNPATNALPYEKLSILDQFVLHRLQEVIEQVRKSFDTYAFYQFYQVIQNFCVIDLSNIYFAIVKDILYIEAANSPIRRAVQTVLHEVLMNLAMLITPVLTHLAEDIWQNLSPELKGHQSNSVLLSAYPQITPAYRQPALAEQFKQVLELRDLANLALEAARNQKSIGKSLEASLTIALADQELHTFIAANHELVRQLMIVSKLALGPIADSPHRVANKSQSMAVGVERATGQKCERCWIIAETVGQSSNHPGLCKRCVQVVENM